MRQIFTKTKAGRRRSELWAPLLYAFTLACGTASAQQAAPEQPALPPLPPPIYHPSDLPPLPPPTEQQLKRGRELLDKIVYVIANVPLTDAADVLKVFGFADLRAVEHPTYVWVGPKGKGDHFAQPAEMVGMGFSHIEVQPWVRSLNHPVIARFSATLATKEACIPIDDVRRIFWSITSRGNSSRIVDIHRIERPTPLHGVGNLSFSSLQNPVGLEAGIAFGFEYQTCARDFTFNYRSNLKEANK